MVFEFCRVFKKRDERAEAGGADMMNEGTIGGETCGEYTTEDLQAATRDLQFQKRRKRRRKLHKDAKVIRLNLRQKITLNENTRYVDIIAKQQTPGGLEQDAADNIYAQRLAEAVIEIEQEEFQLRARFTHLTYRQYYTQWQKNAEYHKNLMSMYRKCNVGPTQKTKLPADAKK